MTTYLVTGGAGFIGSHLVEALVRRGDRVRVLDNLSSGSHAALAPFGGAVELFEGDVRDADAVRAAAEGVSAVIHLAALVSVVQSVEQPRAAYDVNLLGTLSVLDAARAAGVGRVVLASTCAVYGNSAPLPAGERAVPDPASPYAASKLAAEQACRLYAGLYGLETVALRFFNVYGPRQDPASPYAAVVPRFVEALRAGRQLLIYGDGRQSRDFVYVADIVRALLTAAERPGIAGEVFNVGTGVASSVLELAELIGEALCVPARPTFAPARSGEVRDSCADTAHFAERAGFRAAYSLRQGIAALLTSEG